jgi:CRISPR-associated protein Csd1
MLELLVKYARDHGLEAEPGFKSKDVRWAILCNSQGQFLDVIELGDTSKRKNPGQAFAKCPDLSQGELVGGKETRSHFLVDSVEVVTLFGKNASDSKLKDKHRFFVSLLHAASEAMGGLAHIARVLEDPTLLLQIHSRLESQGARNTDKISFRLGDLHVVDSSEWHDWWRRFRAELAGSNRCPHSPPGSRNRQKREARTPSGDGQVAQRCFVTGRLTIPLKTHPKVEGLVDVGGQGAGTTLIGFDKESFGSYGFIQSGNAAVSEEAASAYRSTLNHLIKQYGRRLAGAKIVHWFKETVPIDDDPLAWMEEGTDRQELDAQLRARELLNSIRSGERPDLASNHYYALTLSGSGGRVMVRDWMEGQFGELAGNILSWFEDLSIVHRDGGRLAPSPKLIAVLGSTVRELDDLAAPFVARMWHVAALNEMIPASALAQALLLARMGFSSGESPNHARLGLLKMYLVRKHRISGGGSMKSDLKPYLNEAHPHPAYQCGRLMAVMAGLQRAALGDVGAGIVQRYYAAASSTPALVLGRLSRTSQFHINKLEGGLAYWYESKLAEIWGKIKDSIPATLTLEEQSLFALGYYQQLADLRTRKTEATDDKEAPNE